MRKNVKQRTLPFISEDIERSKKNEWETIVVSRTVLQ